MRKLFIPFLLVLFSILSQDLCAQQMTEKETKDLICKYKWFLRRYESKTQFYTVPKDYQGTYMVFLPNGKVYYHKKGENESNKTRYDWKYANGKMTITTHEGTNNVFDFELKDYIGYKIYIGVRSGDYAGIKYVWERAEENLAKSENSTTIQSDSSSDQDKSNYQFSNVQDLAVALNNGVRSARINFKPPSYSFNITGKTDFDRSSIEFFTKNNQMYLRMNIPRNGSCDYGLKETKAILTGQYGSGGKSFYIAFKYKYDCNSEEFETIYVNFYMHNKAHYEATKEAAEKFITSK